MSEEFAGATADPTVSDAISETASRLVRVALDKRRPLLCADLTGDA